MVFILWRITVASASEAMSPLFGIQKSIQYLFWSPKSFGNKFVDVDADESWCYIFS